MSLEWHGFINSSVFYSFEETRAHVRMGSRVSLPFKWLIQVKSHDVRRWVILNIPNSGTKIIYHSKWLHL